MHPITPLDPALTCILGSAVRTSIHTGVQACMQAGLSCPSPDGTRTRAGGVVRDAGLVARGKVGLWGADCGAATSFGFTLYFKTAPLYSSI